MPGAGVRLSQCCPRRDHELRDAGIANDGPATPTADHRDRADDASRGRPAAVPACAGDGLVRAGDASACRSRADGAGASSVCAINVGFGAANIGTGAGNTGTSASNIARASDIGARASSVSVYAGNFSTHAGNFGTGNSTRAGNAPASHRHAGDTNAGDAGQRRHCSADAAVCDAC
jgi:hypothetical protein